MARAIRGRSTLVGVRLGAVLHGRVAHRAIVHSFGRLVGDRSLALVSLISVEEHVALDLQEPRFEVRSGLEPVEVSERPQHRLLEEIVGVRFVLREPPRGATHCL